MAWKVCLVAATSVAGVASAYALAGTAGERAVRARADVTLTTITIPPLPKPVFNPATVTVTADPAGAMVSVPTTVTVEAVAGTSSSANVSLVVSGFGAGMTLQSVSGGLGNCASGAAADPFTCALGAFGDGNRGSLVLTMLPSTPGTYTIRGQLTAQSNAVNNSPLATGTSTITVVAAAADLGVRAPSATLAPKVGKTVRAGIVFTNDGPVAEQGATLKVALPAQLRLVSAKPSAGTCTGTPLVCSVDLPAHGSDLVVLTLAGLKPGSGSIAVQATGPLADPGAANNSASIAVRVPKPVLKPAPKKR